MTEDNDVETKSNPIQSQPDYFSITNSKELTPDEIGEIQAILSQLMPDSVSFAACKVLQISLANQPLTEPEQLPALIWKLVMSYLPNQEAPKIISYLSNFPNSIFTFFHLSQMRQAEDNWIEIQRLIADIAADGKMPARIWRFIKKYPLESICFSSVFLPLPPIGFLTHRLNKISSGLKSSAIWQTCAEFGYYMNQLICQTNLNPQPECDSYCTDEVEPAISAYWYPTFWLGV